MEFPEMARSLAMRGADLIAVPTNWALDARPYGDEPPQVMLARAAARTNHVHVACADRAGRERDQDFTGARPSSTPPVGCWTHRTRPGSPVPS
ncbi:hypothetical protein GS415_06150 [Rhodococcus hoagii]|nr:hypothetical protein [Prescottella equi]